VVRDNIFIDNAAFTHSAIHSLFYESSKKREFTKQNLYHMPKTFRMAKKMGESLGRSKILQRCLSKN
jgi:hypothetical protein